MRDRGINERGQFLNDPTGLAAILVHPAWASAWTSTRSARSEISSGQKPSPRTARREAWWLTTEAEAALREASEGFRVVDPWEAAISRWIEDRSPIDLQRPVTSQRIMVDVLGLRLSDTDQRAANRVAAVMKRLGWVNRPEWIDGRTQRSGTGRTSRRDPRLSPTHRISTSWDRYRKSNPSSTPYGRRACVRCVRTSIKQALTVYIHILLQEL